MKFPTFWLALLPLTGHAATIDDLWITEVLPSTGEVEVTNVGVGPVTTSSSLPFCHRFRYSDSIPSDTTFAEGESKVFTLNFSNAADTDLWLYRARSFGSAGNIIVGLDWGGGLNGRSQLATPTKWDGMALPSPPEGMALQLIAPDPTKSTSWAVGEADLGRHAFPLGALQFELSEDAVELTWEGGQPPFRVESSTTLEDWDSVTSLLTDRSHVLPRAAGEEARFYRVRDDAMLEESASFRITFSTLWNEERFATVPGSAHFSGLIGATHNDSVVFWGPGLLAPTGIENMAETGSKSALIDEIQAAITAGSAEQVLSGSGLGFAPDDTTLDFTAIRSHPLITLTSMIAPSPDWFVGIRDQPLLEENGDWVESLSFDLLAYDAGTEDGDAFSLSNPASAPQQSIFRIELSDDEFDPSFLPPSGSVSEPTPIARITIERLNESF